MDKWGGHGTAHFKKAAYRRGEDGKSAKEEFKKCCLCRRDVIRKAKAQLELRLGRASGRASAITLAVKD